MSNKKKTILMNAYNVIKQMPDKDLKKYGIEMTPYDGMTDHDMLVNLTKKVDSDHEILMALVKQVQQDHELLIKFINDVNTKFDQLNARIDNLVTKNNLIE